MTEPTPPDEPGRALPPYSARLIQHQLRGVRHSIARAEETLRPLHLAASRAWWNSSISATEEHERQRVEAELALSDALADPELYREVSAARENGADGVARRELDVLYHGLVPNQVPEELRHRIVGLEASVDSRFSKHRAVVGGRQMDDNEIRRKSRSG